MAQNKFMIFSGRYLHQYLENNNEKIQEYINKESEDYLLNVNEIEYTKHLTDKFRIPDLIMDFGSIFVSGKEEMIPAAQFPRGFHVYSGKSYPRQVISYYIPFIGNLDLLRFNPTPSAWGSFDVFIDDGSVCFQLIKFWDDIYRIKNEAETTINRIRNMYEKIVAIVQSYNNGLNNFVEEVFHKRKDRLLVQRNTLASLGIPIKKIDNIPATYSIPTPIYNKSIHPRPQVLPGGYQPHPTLNEEVYLDILQTIHDVGKVMERLPSTYSDKSEENLRDQLLLYLEPRFLGSSTGETFNKSGKTDILIRHENSNVFIAECKFWGGKNKYLSTISQLLGYLTWRDSKSAVIIFSKNKDFSSVLSTIEESTSIHPNYLGFVNNKEDSWFNFRLHIDGDLNREVKLAVLCFHLPVIK